MENVFEKKFIFITGSPRSGTSMVTKILDAHPDVSILMENIHGNRRRHWERASFWDSDPLFKEEISGVYRKLETPIIGNKVITPDVWSAEDIYSFCSMFREVKILFVLRDPVAVAMSRYKREVWDDIYNDIAKRKLMLNFSNRFAVYVSSWVHSIANYYVLRNLFVGDVHLLYYDDIVKNFEKDVVGLFQQLGIDYHPDVKNWHNTPHHDQNGDLKFDLKYPDQNVFHRGSSYGDRDMPDELRSVLELNQDLWDRWKERAI